MYRVSSNIKLKSEGEDIWKAISCHGNLNFFHPFCKKNIVIEGNKKSIKKDILVYLNDDVYERDFYQWDEMTGYKLMIGKKMEKNQKLYGKYLKIKITLY